MEFLVRSEALPASRIIGVETGGCPHTTIREDALINFEAIDEMQQRFPGLSIGESNGVRNWGWAHGWPSLSHYVNHAPGVFSAPILSQAAGWDCGRDTRKARRLPFICLLTIWAPALRAISVASSGKQRDGVGLRHSPGHCFSLL
jgi:hypothetical protein